MLTASFIVAILIEFFVPLALGVYLSQRFKVSWRLFGVGCLTFIASQIVHIPLLEGLTAAFQNGILPMPPESWVLFNPILLGLLSGLCEEPARYIGYRILKKKADSWPSALMLGAGHGGIESILFVGLPVGLNFVQMLAIKNNPAASAGVTAEQINQFWQMAWHLPLAGAFERLAAITLHITLSVIVWQAVSRRQWVWLAAAVLWHATVNFTVVLLGQLGFGIWQIEAFMAVSFLINIGFLVYFYRRFIQSKTHNRRDLDKNLEQKMEANRNSYDTIATIYSEKFSNELDHKPFDKKLLDQFAAAILKSAGQEAAVCDLGCGPGQIANYLSQQGLQAVFGIDHSSVMIEHARHLNPNIEFKQGDMMSLNLPNESLDGLLNFYSLIHIPPTKMVSTLNEHKRTLKPDCLMLVAYHIGSEVLHPEIWHGEHIEIDFIFYPKHEMESYIQEAGFEILESHIRNSYPEVEHDNPRGYILARKPLA